MFFSIMKNKSAAEFMPLSLVYMLFIAASVLLAGCANIRMTNPPRTATEQFLLSQAAAKAVDSVSFDALFGRKIYVDSTYFAPVEKEFILAHFRANLIASGAQITNNLENAEIIIEIRSLGVGIDRYENLLGIPSLSAPAAGAGPESVAASSIILPELAITKNIKQVAFASIAYVAYWRDTGEIVASSDSVLGKSYRQDWWFFGMGPKTDGSIEPAKHKIEK